MKEGKVKFYNQTKGFGFIAPNDGSADVFVHQSALVDRIRDNDLVSFDVQESPKGLNASNVRRIK